MHRCEVGGDGCPLQIDTSCGHCEYDGDACCNDACPLYGQTECALVDGTAAVRACLPNAVGCLEWSAASACATGECKNARQCEAPFQEALVCDNACTEDHQCFVRFAFNETCLSDADCNAPLPDGIAAKNTRVCVSYDGNQYCAGLPDSKEGCATLAEESLDRVGGGKVNVCLLGRDRPYCTTNGRCSMHACYRDEDCPEHHGCVGFTEIVADDPSSSDVFLYKRDPLTGTASIDLTSASGGFVTLKKRDVVGGICECVSDDACVFEGTAEKDGVTKTERLEFAPICHHGKCVCTRGEGFDSCDPEGYGKQRCNMLTGECGCATDALCTMVDKTHPFCRDDGACVCDVGTCEDGFACVDGRCVCDSDEACVALSGGYHSVCINHVCGCEGATDCAHIGPPLMETGNPEIDATLPRKRFDAHPATTLVCEPSIASPLKLPGIGGLEACTCGDRACGDDGCGNSCGACGSWQLCMDGQCQGECIPSCPDSGGCGDDGCGGECGRCATGAWCNSGACEVLPRDCPQLPDTGQSSCHDASGATVPCAGSGQDGAYGNGAATAWQVLDNLRALAKETGLVWRRGEAPTSYSVTDATKYCSGLGEGWRLPTLRELTSIMDYAVQVAPYVDASVFPGVSKNLADAGDYRTATEVGGSANRYLVNFGSGIIKSYGATYARLVRCVQGEPARCGAPCPFACGENGVSESCGQCDPGLRCSESRTCTKPEVQAHARLVDYGPSACFDDTHVVSCPLPLQPHYGQHAQYPMPTPVYMTMAAGTVRELRSMLEFERTQRAPMAFGAATTACADATTGDHDDWRLPFLNEWLVLLHMPDNAAVFSLSEVMPGADFTHVWANGDGTRAFRIAPDRAVTYSIPGAGDKASVRCVRDIVTQEGTP
jgi:hypothetical protein